MNRESANKVRKRSFGTTMGVTSIIAILVILILVVFSTLSLITAKADLGLSQKTANNIKDYYIADSKAEMILASVSKLVSSEKISDIDSTDYAKENDLEYETTSSGHLIKFSVSISDSRKLNAEVLLDNDGNITERQLWQVVPAKEWKEDNQIELFK